MTEEELRAKLQAAKQFKAERIAESEKEIAALQRDLHATEQRLAEWTRMIAVDVFEYIDAANRREATESEEADRSKLKVQAHEVALREAREQGKGMLSPSAASKSTSFGIYGATFGGLLAIYIASFHFSVHSELVLIALGLIGAVAGLFGGFVVFDRNFVVDESITESPFRDFEASAQARQSYFKGRQK